MINICDVISAVRNVQARSGEGVFRHLNGDSQLRVLDGFTIEPNHAILVHH